MKQQCTRSETCRTIRVGRALERLRDQARSRLRSDQGQALIRRRMVETESVFGQLKGNRWFRRFLLRGLPKVNIEVGLLSIAHNLLKKAAVTM